MLHYKKITIIAILGFSSGLPLAIIGSLLQTYFAANNVGLSTIGLLSLVSLPYSIKFLWSPLLDLQIFNKLGVRKIWLALTQLTIALAVLYMAIISSTPQPYLMLALAFLIVFASATQDMAYDAYRTEIADVQERAVAASSGMLGYRIAMFTSGGLAIYIAALSSWRLSFIFIAALMLLCLLVNLVFAQEPKVPRADNTSFIKSMRKALADLRQHHNIHYILLFIIFYKMGDALALSLNSVFLYSKLNFSLETIGLTVKMVTLFSTMLGMFWGSFLINQQGLYRSLFIFGVLQCVTNLLFVWLALIGHNWWAMVVTIFSENLCGGMGTAALVTFNMSICNKKYTAAQYALLSALEVLPRSFMGPVASFLVAHYGWANFYFISFFISLPSLFFLMRFRGLNLFAQFSKA